MQIPKQWTLREVKADWRRVCCEMAALGVLIAAQRLREALLREERSNPYHDELGRFTTPDGAVTGPGHGVGGAGKPSASNNEGRVRVAQAEGEEESSGRQRDVLIQNLGLELQLQIFANQAANRVGDVRQIDRTWNPPAWAVSLNPSPYEELTRDISTIVAAEARLTELGRPVAFPIAEFLRDRGIRMSGIGLTGRFPATRNPISVVPAVPGRGGNPSYDLGGLLPESRTVEIILSGVPLGFRSRGDFDAFGATARNELARSGTRDFEIYLRGSSVTGFRYRSGEPFSEKESDYDLAIVSPSLMSRAEQLGVPLRGGGGRTRELLQAELEPMGLDGAWKQL
jgi:hypothetical protein